ncbi:hypothetical protein ACFQZS_05920 [Mucilaginibacter calamicampi]|uniref:DUF4397 domain-containing protein n=1 Tax=Mucilaginibacter calamicampi TaxID=1302352 RepID=A0ABW2YTA6_9SPHI
MKVFKNIVFLFLLLAAFSACQKEDEVPVGLKAGAKNDSLNTAINLNAPGTFLALKGLLKVDMGDSTYVFDAATDSIAFVSVDLDSNKYFGITAINKAHTVSFGISSAGVARADTNTTIAGSQLLFSKDDSPAVQYTLSKYISVRDMGKINLTKFQQDSTLTKGTFYTILSRQGKASSFYKTTGTFDLRLK